MDSLVMIWLLAGTSLFLLGVALSAGCAAILVRGANLLLPVSIKARMPVAKSRGRRSPSTQE